MPTWLLEFRIDTVAFLTSLDVIAGLAAVYLLARRPTRRWIITAPAAIAIGVGLGFLIAWLVSDVLNVFGLPLTWVTRMWVAITCGGIALALVNLWRSRWWRKLIATVCIPLFLVTAGAAINVDFGAFRSVKDLLGINPYPELMLTSVTSKPSGPLDSWSPPADMLKKGQLRKVAIPGTTSHFPARDAVVYLPPAALVKNPPALPVIELFAGQPGNPSDMFTAGRFNIDLDAYAAEHDGLAAIVVAPDQLIHPDHNPMCVDSPLGNSATYLTVDVPNWVKAHLPVAHGPQSWAVGGYSQGGTCAAQFGFGHPDLFGTTLSISGELDPTIGPNTVKDGFGGSQAAYNAAKPSTLLSKNAPFTDAHAIFGVGQDDQKYQREIRQMLADAQDAGIQTELFQSPRSAHDWNTVRYVLKQATPSLMAHIGLGR